MAPAVEEWRALELARLERLTSVLSDRIEKGDTRSVRTAVQVSKRRCALLGLDVAAPKSKSDVVVQVGEEKKEPTSVTVQINYAGEPKA